MAFVPVIDPDCTPNTTGIQTQADTVWFLSTLAFQLFPSTKTKSKSVILLKEIMILVPFPNSDLYGGSAIKVQPSLVDVAKHMPDKPCALIKMHLPS